VCEITAKRTWTQQIDHRLGSINAITIFHATSIQHYKSDLLIWQWWSYGFKHRTPLTRHIKRQDNRVTWNTSIVVKYHVENSIGSITHACESRDEGINVRRFVLRRHQMQPSDDDPHNCKPFPDQLTTPLIPLPTSDLVPHPSSPHTKTMYISYPGSQSCQKCPRSFPPSVLKHYSVVSPWVSIKGATPIYLKPSP